jgi:hypothetical protein
VHDPTLGGERVLLPLLFDVDQRPLPAAKQEALNAGEGQEVFGGVFGGHNHFMSLRDGVRPSKQSLVSWRDSRG